MVWPVIAAAALGAAGSIFSGKQANKASKQSAREQMLFQERMSNTSHQREVADLKAAGLNPVLSAMGGSGASTPSGASYTAEPVDITNAAIHGASSALDARNKSSTNNLLKAQVNATNASAKQAAASGNQTEAMTRDLLPLQVQESRERIANLAANTGKTAMDAHNAETQGRILDIGEQMAGYTRDAKAAIPPEWRAFSEVLGQVLGHGSTLKDVLPKRR